MGRIAQLVAMSLHGREWDALRCARTAPDALSLADAEHLKTLRLLELVDEEYRVTALGAEVLGNERVAA